MAENSRRLIKDKLWEAIDAAKREGGLVPDEDQSDQQKSFDQVIEEAKELLKQGATVYADKEIVCKFICFSIVRACEKGFARCFTVYRVVYALTL